MIICYFLYRREVFLGSVKVVHCNLIHCNVHYRTVRTMAMMLGLEIWLTNRWGVTTSNTYDAAAVLFLNLLRWLENRWQQTLILHE